MLSQSVDKRVVLLHTQGPLAGLFQIQGCVSELPGPPPTYVEPSVFIRPPLKWTMAGASLIKAKTRYLLYREYKPELLGIKGHHEGDTPRFSPSQR